MTAPTDQFTDIAKRSQDAFTTVTRTWLDLVQSVAGPTDTSGPGASPVPNVLPYVDGLFDVAEKFLSNQRVLAHQWVDAAMRTTEAVTEQAVRATKSVSAHSANGAEAAVDNTADAVRATGEQAASSARAAHRTAAG